MDRLFPTTLAVILAVVGAGFADEYVENSPDQNQLITAAVGRVNSLLPGMTPEAVQRAKERVVAIEAAIRARQDSLFDEQVAQGRDLEVEWRSRWSFPAEDRGRSEPSEDSTDAHLSISEATGESSHGVKERSSLMRLDESTTTSGTSVPVPEAAVATSPQLLPEERGLLIADGIALFGRALQEASRTYNLRPGFLLCVMQVESAFNPTAISRAGAIGLMQLMPTTAEELGANPYDLTENINGGARLIASHLDYYSGDVALAMAAYNAGPGAVERYRGVPPYPETQNYVARILQNCGDPRP
jgi:hypothetical protein